LAIRIIGAFVPGVLDQMDAYMKKMEAEVMGKVERLDNVVSIC
jgi:phosphoribosylaminoimidazole carboxylase